MCGCNAGKRRTNVRLVDWLLGARLAVECCACGHYQAYKLPKAGEQTIADYRPKASSL